MRKEANPFHPICMLRIAMARVFLMKLKGKEREGSINSTVCTQQGVYTTHPRRVKREKSFETGGERIVPYNVAA